MTHTLPKLPFDPHALEPVISAKTIEFHYGKHHQAYVNNLNKLIPGSPFAEASLEEIVRKAEGGIFNNGAQVWNHTFYWESLSPEGGGEPKGKLMEAIEDSFGSFEKFKEEFSQAAATLFGSGWAWLVKNGEGKLEIVKESNAGNPMRSGKAPLLTCDVWEHAYYLDYQNRRPDYIESFWKLVNWNKVESRL
ncbi:MAG: superoxide dismutase [Bacteroides sp.]|nr:superoxide dismutase [Bacteroides sp.]